MISFWDEEKLFWSREKNIPHNTLLFDKWKAHIIEEFSWMWIRCAWTRLYRNNPEKKSCSRVEALKQIHHHLNVCAPGSGISYWNSTAITTVMMNLSAMQTSSPPPLPLAGTTTTTPGLNHSVGPPDYFFFNQTEDYFWEDHSESDPHLENFSKVIRWMNVYFLPALILVGLVGNSLSVAVFILSHLRRLSSSVYLAALAVADAGFLLCALADWCSHIGFQFSYNNGKWFWAVFYSELWVGAHWATFPSCSRDLIRIAQCIWTAFVFSTVHLWYAFLSPDCVSVRKLKRLVIFKRRFIFLFGHFYLNVQTGQWTGKLVTVKAT